MLLIFNEFIKLTSGRLRPDFLDRCQPINNICTGRSSLVIDGRKSFFSGHTSTSFYASTFLVLWMCESGWKLLGFRSGKNVTPSFVIICSMLPYFLSSYIGISRYFIITRTQQYIHFPSDVFVGALMGVFFAVLIYKYHVRYFNF